MQGGFPRTRQQSPSALHPETPRQGDWLMEGTLWPWVEGAWSITLQSPTLQMQWSFLPERDSGSVNPHAYICFFCPPGKERNFQYLRHIAIANRNSREAGNYTQQLRTLLFLDLLLNLNHCSLVVFFGGDPFVNFSIIIFKNNPFALLYVWLWVINQNHLQRHFNGSSCILSY